MFRMYKERTGGCTEMPGGLLTFEFDTERRFEDGAGCGG